MPINPIVLQRRHAELGRIRLGEKGSKGQPQKLSTFRFTSPNHGLIAQIADLYGGAAKPWDNAGKPEHEVTTDAKSIPVIVVKGGFSQWLETWTGGGCVHRCDGVTNDLTKEPCDPDDPAHIEAKPTTRLSVMLRDVESLGVWRMESHGWNAAAELPSMAELAMFVGDLVPAMLHLVERSSKIKVRGKITTSRYVVPVLDLEVSKQRLVELVGGHNSTPALEGGQGTAPAAIGATPYPSPGYGELLQDATTVDECTAIWRQAGQAGHLDDELKAVITSRVEQLKAEDATPSDEPAEADVVDELTGASAREEVWMQLVLEAGKHGVTDSELRTMLEEQTAQPVDDVTTEQLQQALDALRAKAAS